MMCGRRILAGAAVVAAFVAGCSDQQTLPMARRDGNVAYANGNYELARQKYQDVVDRNRDNAEDKYNLGLSLMGLERYQEAHEQFRQAYELAPKNQEYFAELCESMYATGQIDKLFASIRSRLRDKSDSADALLLAEYAQRIGALDEAVQALEQAIELDAGESADPYVAQATFYRSIGDTENELRSLRVVLSFDLENETVNARIRELGQIPGPSLAITPEPIGSD